MIDEKIVLVCVTDQKRCERLIRMGHKLAEMLKLKLKVLSIQPSTKDKILKGTDLEHLFNICRSLDAEMQVYWADNESKVAVDYIRKNNVLQLVMGKAAKMQRGNFYFDIHNAFPDIPITDLN